MRPDGLTREERSLFSRLDAPGKIQDFLNAIPINREPEGDTCLSPRRVLRERRAHCIEGAMLAAAILRHHGERPLIVDMEGAAWDEDHVIAVFQKRGHWGAISKTNHYSLRYREPVYRTIRELIMSYFHEYTPLDNDRKSLRAYSNPIDLSRFDRRGWLTDEQDVWYVPEYLVEAKHFPILDRGQIASLRRADPIEVRAAELEEWPKRRAGGEARNKK
jgi:hypothetical protein